MKPRFVVIDHEGAPSWSVKNEAPESFATPESAERRARELAGYSPGQAIGVFEKITEVVAPVGKVVTQRKAPRKRG